MNSCEVGKGVHSFDTTFWLLHFMNAVVMFDLSSQNVQQTIINNIPANNIQDVLFKFLLVVLHNWVATHEEM